MTKFIVICYGNSRKLILWLTILWLPPMHGLPSSHSTKFQNFHICFSLPMVRGVVSISYAVLQIDKSQNVIELQKEMENLRELDNILILNY